MHGPNTLPLIDKIEIKPILDLLDEAGTPASEILARANIPMRHPDDPGAFVSARSILRFVSLAAREVGIENLGWRAAARSEITQLGRWGKAISSCLTLREAIGAFCESYSREVSFVELGLSFNSEYAWFWRRRDLVSRDPADELQGEQFMLGSMIRVVRLAAGRQWTPPVIKLDSGSGQWLESTPDLQDCHLLTGGPVMAIALPTDMLDQRLPQIRSSRAVHGGMSETRAFPHDFVGSLHAALASASLQTPLSLELGAEIAETSPRTLRRWLTREGTSWRDMVDRIHFERATQLLQHTSLTLAEISDDLGYSDPSHFTRAFRRWAGEAPRDYRQRKADKESSLKQNHH